MNWIQLTDEARIAEIIQLSHDRPQLIFKHSTRCSISSMALARLERGIPPAHIDFYFLDLIRYRSVSNSVAETFGVHHESPQVLLIIKGECVYEESHSGITMNDIAEQAVPA